MINAFDENNEERLREKAHKTKSAIGIFGLEKLFMRLNVIENGTRILTKSALNSEIVDIFLELRLRIIEIEKYLELKTNKI